MNKQIFWEYFRTFILTILGSVFVILIILLFTLNQISSEYAIQQKSDSDELNLELVDLLIEKNKYLLEEHPENYKIDSRLGFLYEAKRDYKNAELEYKEAVAKCPYHEFKPHYELAMFYAKRGELEKAELVMEKLGEKPVRKLVAYKSELYAKLGDTYYEKADYHEAALKYEKAVNYQRVLNTKTSKKAEKLLNGNLASSYIYLAEEKVSEMQIEEAINYLTKAKAIINAPIISYKLGLLYIQTNPELANAYFEEVFKREPSLINYEEYYNLLTSLATEAEYDGDYPKSALYQFKIKKLKNYYNENLLAVADIGITNPIGEILVNKWLRKYRVDFSFSLKNTSKYNLNSLFLDIVFKDGDEVIERFTKQIVDDKVPLKSEEEVPVVSIKTKPITDIVDFPKEITVQIYASKKEDSRQLLLQELVISQKQQTDKRKLNWFELFCLKYIYPYIGF